MAWEMSRASTHRLREVLGRGHRVAHGLDLRAEVEPDDLAPLLGQTHRVGASLATSSAGDEGHLAVESTHDAARLAGRPRLSGLSAAGRSALSFPLHRGARDDPCSRATPRH